tara:strand:+ start:2887 stop:3588 length:702 start_codon:yes stop_codon:yes gene_type:complete
MKTYREISEGINRPVPLKTIESVLSKAGNKIIGRTVKPAEIATEIDKALNTKWDVELNFDFSITPDPGMVIVDGAYDAFNNDHGETPFFLTLYFNRNDKQLSISTDGWNVISRTVADVMQHELAHQAQHHKRGGFANQRKFTRFTSKAKDIQRDQEYLGNDDEIESFALNISQQLISSQGSKEAALKRLRNFKSIKRMESFHLLVYLDVFGYDPKHAVVKKLINKVVRFINST